MNETFVNTYVEFNLPLTTEINFNEQKPPRKKVCTAIIYRGTEMYLMEYNGVASNIYDNVMKRTELNLPEIEKYILPKC